MKDGAVSKAVFVLHTIFICISSLIFVERSLNEGTLSRVYRVYLLATYITMYIAFIVFLCSLSTPAGYMETCGA